MREVNVSETIFYRIYKTRFVSIFVYRRQSRDRFRSKFNMPCYIVLMLLSLKTNWYCLNFRVKLYSKNYMYEYKRMRLVSIRSVLIHFPLHHPSFESHDLNV